MDIYGLKKARFAFTEIINTCRTGEDVLILEIGHDRRCTNGYRLVKLSDEEIAELRDSRPDSDKPRPLPSPLQIFNS